jgi:regulation of enolase protein 1 (concanavalin A-like superfamily)
MRVATFALVLAAVSGPPALAQSMWETVTSKEGPFTVEMPKKPSFSRTQTRKGPDGAVKVFMTGCDTPAGGYIAYRIELPTAVVKGAEDAQLDSERDSFAKEFNGKVISEKKVRAEGKLGRDFTIRGKPGEEPGVVTIRVRLYLVGKAVYAVMVVSAPNRELPEDTGRFLGSLAIGTTKPRPAATSEPEPTGREVAGWGMAIDPGMDCQIRAEGAKLSIEVPGTLHDLTPRSGKLNAPRVLRPVEGDFQVTVKVAGDFKASGKSTNPRSVPYNGAGILLWSDADNFIRLERGAMTRGGKRSTFVAFQESEFGYSGAVHNETFPPGPCYLRLERKGNRISGAVSADGKAWKQLKPIDTYWPAKLKVGQVAISSSSEPFTATFEEFKKVP